MRRHATRPERAKSTADAVRRWHHGWQPLDVVEETRFDDAATAVEALDAVLPTAAPSVAACSRAAGPDPHRPAGGDALP
ncbi:MAG: hypothetical protein PGN11_01765 [Quadrisphaera sp.]